MKKYPKRGSAKEARLIQKIKRANKEKICKTCYGFGFWGFGLAAPIGPMDFREGYPTKPCPECGANKRPIKK